MLVGATVSLEGVAVKFFPPGDDTTTMEFHSYFSDGKQSGSRGTWSNCGQKSGQKKTIDHRLLARSLDKKKAKIVPF